MGKFVLHETPIDMSAVVFFVSDRLIKRKFTVYYEEDKEYKLNEELMETATATATF